MPVTTTEPKFHCSACGKEYRWKPELAAKKAKCKCGNVITVPSSPPAPAAARPAPRPAVQDDDLDGLYALAQEEKKAAARPAALTGVEAAGGYRCPSCSAGMAPGSVICPNCQLDIRTGMRQVAVAGAGARGGVMAAAGAYVTATAAGRGGGAAVLPYGGGGTRTRTDEDILFEGGRFRSLYLPIGLIVLGILFYVGQIAFSNNKITASVLVGMVAARVVLDSLLILTAMLIAVRGFDMGFGAFGPGILKILAVAMGPGALGEMVEQMVGGGIGGIMVGALVAVVLYFSLIKVLFNLDLGETFLLVVLIIGVRRVLGTFLFVALMGMANSGMIESDSALAVGGGTVAISNARTGDPDVPPIRPLDPAEIVEGLNSRALATLRYHKGGSPPETYFDLSENNRFTNMDRPRSIALVKAFTDAGAAKVTAIDFIDAEGPDGGRMSLASGLVVELPEDKAARKKIFDIRAEVLKSLGQQEDMIRVEVGGGPDDPKKEEPLKDWGQGYLVFDFGSDKTSKYYGQSRYEQRMKDRLAAEKAEEAESGKAPAGETTDPADAGEDPGEMSEDDDAEMSEDEGDAPF
jgi:hypothetical protein